MKNDQNIKNLELICVILSNYEEFHVSLSNEEIRQNLILRAKSTIIGLFNICLKTDNKSKLIQSKDVVVKSIDTNTLLGRANQKITIERKDRLKTFLSEDYRNICAQDHRKSKLLFAEDSAENVRRAKTNHSINLYQQIQTLSATPSSSSVVN